MGWGAFQPRLPNVDPREGWMPAPPLCAKETPIEIVQTAKCPKCGAACKLQVLQYTNKLQILQCFYPNLECDRCRHQWDERNDSYERDLHDAFWAPHIYWSEEGPAQMRKLAHALSLERQAEFAEHFDDLHAAVMLRYARATEAGSSSTFLAMCSAADEDKFRIFDGGFKLWCTELVALQCFVVNELERVWVSYQIPESDREWVPEAANVIWKPIQKASLRWIIEALGISADAKMWIAPDWLYCGPLESIKLRSMDKWEATQNLLLCLSHTINRRLASEREQALNDAFRERRLVSPKRPIEEPFRREVPRSKLVREGETVEALYEQLKKVRNLYRDNGWLAARIRQHTAEFTTLWEWVDRLPTTEKRDFLAVEQWEDGDKFIFLQIVALYRHASHLSRKPQWATVRDWRKAYRRSLKKQAGFDSHG